MGGGAFPASLLYFFNKTTMFKNGMADIHYLHRLSLVYKYVWVQHGCLQRGRAGPSLTTEICVYKCVVRMIRLRFINTSKIELRICLENKHLKVHMILYFILAGNIQDNYETCAKLQNFDFVDLRLLNTLKHRQ